MVVCIVIFRVPDVLELCSVVAIADHTYITHLHCIYHPVMRVLYRSKPLMVRIWRSKSRVYRVICQSFLERGELVQVCSRTVALWARVVPYMYRRYLELG